MKASKPLFMKNSKWKNYATIVKDTPGRAERRLRRRIERLEKKKKI